MNTWYRDGTVSVIAANPNILGAGTLWLTQAAVGDIFVGPDLALYEITEVSDDTHAAVKQLDGTAEYGGSTLSDQGYAIVRNFTSTLPAVLASQLATLMTNYHVTLDELTAWLSGTGTVTVHDSSGTPYDVLTPAAMVILNTTIYKGASDCSANPDYPAGVVGDTYRVSVGGKIGGASGKAVVTGDYYVCGIVNAGGTEASVGADWDVIHTSTVVGATGPTGATGATGATGPAGPPGTPGASGAGSGDALLNAPQTWGKGQRGGVVTLTSSAGSIAIDLEAANNFKHTMSEDSSLAMPTNPVEGQSGIITFTQPVGSPFTALSLGYHTFWNFPAGAVPSLTATPGAVDNFTYYVESATRATCNLIKDSKR